MIDPENSFASDERGKISNIPFYRVFSTNEYHLEKMYIQRAIRKYGDSRIKFCLILLGVDSLTRELLVVFDEYVIDKVYSFRILGWFLGILILLIGLTKMFRSRERLFKYAIAAVLGVRFIQRGFELLYFSFYSPNPFRRLQIVKEMLLLYQVDSFFMNTVGLFYFRDCLLYAVLNVFLLVPLVIYMGYTNTPILIHHLFIAIVYNLIDAYFHFTHELQSFTNLIQIERKSLRLGQFVNRLLPKHVSFTIFY